MEFLTKLKVELPCDPACSRERQPTPVFLPGDPTDTGAWRATVHAITKSGTRLSVSTHDPTGFLLRLHIQRDRVRILRDPHPCAHCSYIYICMYLYVHIYNVCVYCRDICIYLHMYTHIYMRILFSPMKSWHLLFVTFGWVIWTEVNTVRSLLYVESKKSNSEIDSSVAVNRGWGWG